MDLDFKEIVGIARGQWEAFEELCCQLARRAEQPRQFVRIRGDGGDGGIEGYVELPDGKRGWQAKYVFDSSRLVNQASESFRTALENHPDLTSFVLCFPFDPTGKTRRGSGGIQNLEDWKASELRYAEDNGRHVEIELWSASELRARIIECDASGGMRRFFFGQHVLTDQWFKDHLDQARKTAGPRYTPELNVETGMVDWFAAVGRTNRWSSTISARLRSLEKSLSRLHVGIAETDEEDKAKAAKAGEARGTWPNDSHARVKELAATIEAVAGALRSIVDIDRQKCLELKRSLRSSSAELRSIETKLALDLDHRYGEGAWDSPSWRQYMAEWEVSFPAANLDSVRDVLSALDAFVNWLDSHEFTLGLEAAFVLTGVAGSGKTHGVCDVAHRRHQEGLRTCMFFGHQFSEGHSPWTKIGETLGLPALGRDELLDAMNSAGEASGAPLIICIDAINETRPLRYWRDQLLPLLQAVGSRTFLRACIVCRTPYVSACLPEGIQLPKVEHQGFSGIEREACRAYFEHYGLQPPAMPILQPELANPLYLRLVCETARYLKLPSLPTDWSGSGQAIKAFLHQKETRFADSHAVPVQARIMRKTLRAVVDRLAACAETEVSWSAAVEVVLERVELDRERASRYLAWLVGEGLLIDDPSHDPYSDNEGSLRPAFERLGDFLVADAILSDNAGGSPELAPWIGTMEEIERHSGVLSVLSVLLPERDDGVELPDMADDPERSEALLELTVDSLPSRSAAAFTDRSEVLARRALSVAHLSHLTMERLVSIAWRPSPLDAHWLDRLLRSKALADRDAYWCAFLHESFAAEGAVAQIIEAAFDLPLEEVDLPVAERWAKLLIWFTAAADRRVKDRATRAAVALLAGRPSILPKLMERMLTIDDDTVRERLLLASYGALLQTRHLDTLASAASTLHRCYTDDASAFANALIRDHIRTICEFAAHLDVLPAGVSPDFASEASNAGGAWPLPLPSDDGVKAWSRPIRLWPDGSFSDFFAYSMGCMKRWEDGMCRQDMAKWMLQTIAQDFQFIGSGCESYDRRMLHEHGGGRNKPVWAERIGKKYTWVAMYQLASRLHDNVEPKRDSWEPKPTCTPLVLAEQRQLDPSLPQRRDLSKRHQFFAALRLDTAGASNDQAWVALEEDVPTVAKLVEVQSVGGQDWRPLVAYLSSERPDSDDRGDSPYRQIWLHLLGYLVRPSHADRLFDKLNGRNFCDLRMPEGLQLGSPGFAAEYPWATSFNTIPDEWYSRTADPALDALLPAWNNLSCEWEYDASLENMSAHVPARLFFDGDDLWWDGQGGYKRGDGRTVFFDPSIGLAGPSTLLVDAKYLGARLRAMDQCLIWTLLGRKWMLGGSIAQPDPSPTRMFGQVAYMDADGKIRESDLLFFDAP